MAQPALAETPEEFYGTDMSVGEILRRARLHYGQSLKDVERNLRIRAIQLEAIENSRYDQLPGRVYAIGFLRSYAEYLGLDGPQMVELFKMQYANTNRSPELNFPVAAKDSKLPNIWVVAGSVAGIVVLLMIWGLLHSSDRSTVTEIPPVPESFKAEAVQGTEPFGPEAPPAPVEENGIMLNITENSWVEIRDLSGQILVSKVLKAGDQYLVPARPDLTMDLGNAGGVQIMIDGKTTEALGKPGQVRRDIPLDIQKLDLDLKDQLKEK